MSATRVSVVLCTHQGAAHLQDQLDSLAAQTHAPAELVVRDDGSTDATASILDRFAASAAFPVTVDHGDHVGLARSMQAAIGSCDGDLIALCDQDDAWDPTKLAKAVALLDARPAASAAVSNGSLVDADGESLHGHTFEALGFTSPLQATFGRDPVQVLAHRSVVTGHSLVFRQRVARRALPFPEPLLADIDAIDAGPGRGTVPRPDRWIALVAAGLGSIVLLDEPLVAHRQHAEQITGIDARPWVHAGREARRWAGQVLRAGAGTRQRLVDRADLLDAAATRTDNEALAAAAAHLRWRSELPDRRLARVGLVRREQRDGGYRWSGGVRVALADAVRPLG